MATRKKHLINVHTSTGTTAPTGASLYLGEIAVQHTTNNPGLWIKMGTTEASTTYEKFIGKTEITNMVSATSGLVNDLSAVTLTGVTMNNSPVNVTNHVANLGTVITAETQLSTATTGTGNVVGSIGVSNHKITTTMFSAASASQLATLSGAAHNKITALSSATVAHINSAASHVSTTDRTTWNGKQDAISDLGTIRNNALSGASAYTRVNSLSAGTIALVAASAASVYSSAVSYTNQEIGKLDSTGVTSDSGHYLTSVTITNGKISAVGEVAVPAESNITTASTGNGNVITNITATGHALTLTKGITAATSGQVSALSSATVAHINSAASHVSATDRTTWNGKQDAISDLSTIRNNALSGASAYTRVNSLSAATTAHTANTTVHVTAADKTKWNAAVTGVTSAGTGNAFTEYSIADNILTLTKGATYLTTAATTTQGTRADNALQIVSGSTYIDLSAKSGNAGAKMQTATVKQQGVETASATGQGLADAYDVKQYVEGLVTSSVDYKGATATLPTTSTVGDLYITTAQIALTAAQSATGAAQTAETGDFIIARSSGKWDVVQKNLDGAVTGSLTADTVTLGAGEHTVKSLANGSNGQVLSISSNKPAWVNASLTDTATTETGHYTPSTSASTKGTTAATANYVKGIRIDSKNHVIDVVTGTVVTAQTQLTYNSGASVSNNASSVMTGLTASNHAITYGKTNKIFSAGTADSAATLTGNITTGQVTDLTTKIQTTKVNSATTADSATNAAAATKVKSALTINTLNATGGTASTVTFDGSANKTVNIPANTDEHVTAVGNHYTATTATKTGGTTTSSAASAIKGVTYDAAGHIVGVTTGSVLTSFTETQLSTASTGTGNVVCGLTVSNHKITTLMFSAAPADALVALSAATTTHTANTTMHITSAERTRWNNAWTSGVSAYTKVEQLSAGTLYELKQTNHNIPYIIQSGNTYTGSTYEYVAETDELTELADGQSVIFHPKQNSTTGTTNGSASTCSLSVKLADGTTTTPRPIYLGKNTKITTHIQGCSDIKLTYHDNATWSGVTGLCGWWVDFYYADGNTVPTQLYGMGVIKSDNAFARYALAMQTSAGTWNSVVTTSSTATTKTPTTKGFLLGSDVIYYNANLAANTNGSANSGYVALNSLDFRYSSNAGSTLTAGLPVYLVGTVNPDDGLFYLDSTTWWSQSLPTVDNGKVYIYVGNAIGTYQIALHPEHPIYEYKNGYVRLYQEGSDILGPSYTYSGLPYVTSATSIADAYSALTKMVIDDERVIAEALNEHNGKILAISGDVETLNEKIDNFHVDMILGSGYTYSGIPYVNSSTTIADAYSALTQEIIYDEEVTSEALNDLNSRVIEISGNVANIHVDMILGSGYTYSGIPYVNSSTTIADAYSALTYELFEDELVISSSLNDLRDDIRGINGGMMVLGSGYTCSGIPYVNGSTTIADAYSALTKELRKDEKVISAALNDLNGRILSLDSGLVTTISHTSSNSVYPSAKAVYDEVHPKVITTGGDAYTITIEPNVLYNLGTLSGDKTFNLGYPEDANTVNHYYWTFEAGSTVPTITWPDGLTWYGGGAPTIVANKHYEVSVLNGIAVSMEV